MTVLFALLLLIVLLACWPLSLLSLPGNWMMVAAAAVYAYFMPADSRAAIGWMTITAMLVLAGLGEVIELLAGAVGTAQAGGTRRGAVLALLGSVVGGLVGLLVGIPIPIVGSFFAAILFAALGALVGAMLGEFWAGRKWGASWRVGTAAFGGRLFGTLGKMAAGAMILVLALAALLF